MESWLKYKYYVIGIVIKIKKYYVIGIIIKIKNTMFVADSITALRSLDFHVFRDFAPRERNRRRSFMKFSRNFSKLAAQGGDENWRQPFANSCSPCPNQAAPDPRQIEKQLIRFRNLFPPIRTAYFAELRFNSAGVEQRAAWTPEQPTIKT